MSVRGHLLLLFLVLLLLLLLLQRKLKFGCVFCVVRLVVLFVAHETIKAKQQEGKQAGNDCSTEGYPAMLKCISC